MTTVSNVYAALREVIDTNHNRDIVDLGYVQNIRLEEKRVAFDIILPDAK